MAGIEIKQLEKQYAGKGYGDFKKDLAEVMVNFLSDFQKKYNAISDEEVDDIMRRGAVAAREIADETLGKAKRAIGVL